MSDALIGKSIGNLEIVSKIASGGMGTVYKAEHNTLRTPYAVKVLHSNFHHDKTSMERFRREAMTSSQLRHPNVVFVTDFGHQSDLGLYLIMEYLEGDPLSQVLQKNKAMSLGRTARIGEQVCDALEAAHALNVVHRDLKPDNIILVRGKRHNDLAKVLDFGIAQIQQSDDVEKLTRAGLVLGTPAYISPEQINGKAAQVGPGADIYALGAIFYEMVGGTPPFTEGTDFEILSQHMFETPAPISSLRSDLADTALEKLLTDMLAKRPEERPRSMGEVHQRLNEAIDELKERGVQDTFYQSNSASGDRARRSGDSGLYSLATPAPLRITNVIKHIRSNSPDSAAASLLNAFPGMVNLQEEIFLMALWGVLQRELMDLPINSERFNQATDHFRLYVEATLEASDKSDAVNTARLLRSVAEFFKLSDQARQQPIIAAIQPLTRHHRFPMDILPEWAQPRASGTWQAFKNLMTTELRLPFGSRPRMKAVELPEDTPAATPPPTEATATPPQAAVQVEAPQKPAPTLEPAPIQHSSTTSHSGLSQLPPAPLPGMFERKTPRPKHRIQATAPSQPRRLDPLDALLEADTDALDIETATEGLDSHDADETISDERYEESLMDKLSQDVSLRSLSSVLTHEISFFKRKKKTPSDDKE